MVGALIHVFHTYFLGTYYMPHLALNARDRKANKGMIPTFMKLSLKRKKGVLLKDLSCRQCNLFKPA